MICLYNSYHTKCSETERVGIYVSLIFENVLRCILQGVFYIYGLMNGQDFGDRMNVKKWY